MSGLALPSWFPPSAKLQTLGGVEGSVGTDLSVEKLRFAGRIRPGRRWVENPCFSDCTYSALVSLPVCGTTNSSGTRVAPDPPTMAAPRDTLYTPANSTLNINAVPAMTELTHILSAIDQGDPHAADQLLPFVYDELRRLAAARMANEAAGHTLDATALVHEG